MKRNCNRQQETMRAAFDGELDESRRAESRAHALECADCGEMFGFYAALLAERAGTAEELPPALYYEGVLAELHLKLSATAARPLQLRRPAGRRQVATAAACAMAGFWCCLAAGSIDGGKGSLPAATAGALSTSIVATAPAEVAAENGPTRLVELRGMGLVPGDSPLLALNAKERKELLLPPDRPPMFARFEGPADEEQG